MAGQRDYFSWLVLGLVVAVVFAASYYVYVNLIAPTDHYVSGVRVVSHGDPRTAISGVFISRNVTVQLDADNLTDRTLACPTLAFAEATAGISAAGFNVTAQGRIAGEYCINANSTKIPCRQPQLVVQRGPCNCLAVVGSAVVVEGSDNWFCSNGPKIRDALKWALQKN